MCTYNFAFLDRNHFDNPVYACQGSGSRDDDKLLNNTNHIRNNLQKQNNMTLEKQRRLGCLSDDDDLSSKGKQVKRKK